VDRFAAGYTPAVVALAALVAVLPPALGYGAWADWLYRALALLVIACPCALVISTPVSIVSALTAASRRGVLIKGGAHLEALGRVRAFAFDKTGTLTTGRLEVTDVLVAPGASRDEVLASAAALETNAGHPLGAAILSATGRVDSASAVETLPGRGVRGRVAGREVLAGSHRLLDEEGLCDHRLDADLLRLEADGKTVVMVGRPGEGLLGAIAVADALRPEAPAAIEELRRMGLATSLLTGDNPRTAEAIARQAGLDSWSAALLPEDKVAKMAALKAAQPTGMVGDGVNDAPALAASSVGIAMGARGADAALETADVVLMAEDLRRIPEAVRLGRAALRRIHENVGFSIAVKLAVLVFAVAGYGSLWTAVAADMGASLVVIGNGLRLLRAGRPPAPRG
jgi:Cd2+/Zn2+-exporting ATPase